MADNVSTNDAEKQHNQKKPKDSTSVFQSLVTVLKEIRGEFNKVLWPSKAELAKKSVTVVATSLLFGLIIVVYDGAFAFCLRMFSSLVTK